MLTAAADRSLPADDAAVVGLADLARDGWTYDEIDAQLRARRWQRIGRAVVRHNGPPSAAELRRAALIAAGPRSALTSFTSLEECGLRGWERPTIHLLVPRGARVGRPAGLSIRLHYAKTWDPSAVNPARRLHRPGAAVLRAAGSFDRPRFACGILAAAVQQRIVTPRDVLAGLDTAARTRHRAVLRAAMHDIAQGAEALSEIDFARLCRRAGLPPPVRQAVRTTPGGATVVGRSTAPERTRSRRRPNAALSQRRCPVRAGPRDHATAPGARLNGPAPVGA